MSAITVGGDLVHYEVLGRGRPVILLHGWLGSWRYWVPTMQQLHLKYRVYAIDLFGFGDSSKNPEKYTITHQVNLVDEFMKQLGIPKAAMIGHGLGAVVLAEYALENQDKVHRLMISSAPLFDPGDLESRLRPGQRRLLTQMGNPANELAQIKTEAPVLSPSVVPLTNNTDETVASRSMPEPTPVSGTATATASTSEATIVRKPDSLPLASLSSHDLPTVPRVNADNRARIEEAAKAAGTPPPSPDNEPLNPAQASAQKIDLLAALMLSNQNPLMESMAGATLNGLLGKCFKSSEAIYEKLKIDVDKTDDDILKHSVKNFDSGRMLDTLRLLGMPVVVVHGSDDPIIPQPTESVWNYLTADKDDLVLPIPLPGVRHFPMLEHEPFIRLASQFLEIPEISKLEVKERWVRRTR